MQITPSLCIYLIIYIISSFLHSRAYTINLLCAIIDCMDTEVCGIFYFVWSTWQRSECPAPSILQRKALNRVEDRAHSE